MAEIKPFQGLHYNPSKFKDFSKVVAPPYDVISPKLQECLYKRNKYNFVRISLNKGVLDETIRNNRYIQAKKEYTAWIKQKILVQDKSPCFYLCSQEFELSGKKYNRIGFFALLKLEDKNSAVFPHEHTHDQPKVDRLKMTLKLKANLSPVFCLFHDKSMAIKKLYDKIKNKTPFIAFTDDNRVLHRCYKITNKNSIELIKRSLGRKELFIADGHHRFEVACQYREIMKSKVKSQSSQEKYNYVMVYLTNADSKDNLILPYHRIVAKKTVDKPRVMSYIKKNFQIKRLPSKEALAAFLKQNKKKSGVFGAYFPNEFYGLCMKKGVSIEKDLFKGQAQKSNGLDVVILQKLLLDKLSLKEGELIYTKDDTDCFDLVDKNQAKFSVLVNPVKMNQLKSIVSEGLRMPQKSTYFYPKVTSGLVVNSLE